MKGWLSSTLLLCLIVPFFGAWQFLSIQIHQIREQVHAIVLHNLTEDQKLLLTFSNEDALTKLEWEHSREFEYNGEMYDVISLEVNGDSTSYLCYHDVRETRAKNELRNVIASALGSTPHNQKSQSHITDFLKTLFPIEPVHFRPIAESTAERNEIKRYQFSATIHLAIPPTPPPEFS